jgi:putative endonuclease
MTSNSATELEPLKTYYVYMLKCSNSSYYTGYTVDMEKRYQKHLEGAASKYTRSFKPKKIAACWSIESRSPSVAMQLEIKIKKLTAAQKTELILKPELIAKLITAPIKALSYTYRAI